MRKRSQVVEVICRGSCPFYKAGEKEDLACQGFVFFNEYVNSRRMEEIRSLIPDEMSNWRSVDQNLMYGILCGRCSFLTEGCNFHSLKQDREDIPCGGYMVLAELWERRVSWLQEIVSQLRSK